MRALGLDVGSRRIGVAVTDEANIAAHPLTVLERSGAAGDRDTILALVVKYDITDVVLGMPYELSGRIGHRARRVAELARVLRTHFSEILGEAVTLHEQDERFTTAEAERVLIAANVSRTQRRQVLDQQAAAIILQTWLDAQRQSR